MSSTYLHENDFRNLAINLLGIAHKAGATIMPYYQTDLNPTQKPDDSPVTVADKAAEAIIIEALTSLCPDIPVVAEELASAGNIPKIDEVFFLVDPLDGTREFIGGHAEFTVNIALIVKKRPLLGVVYAPALADIYVTLSKNRAYRAYVEPGTADFNPSNTDFHEIRARNANMSALTAVASRSHLDDETRAFLADFSISEITPAGSSIKFCRLATGEADLYPRFGRTMEWDTAAGDCILTAAGGSVSQIDGEPFLYGKTEKGFANSGFICWGER